jgi:DNA-binding winged helix-turn-helix (wHTH) protein/TolB-like protein/Flp pilus assembly protein TadD
MEPRRFYKFGPYSVDIGEHRLLCGDEPISLTPKAFETLLVLVENAGRGLTKDELLRRVWPDSFVEEGSLTRNISVLRKALGDDDERYIETVPKRGYRFVAPIEELRVPEPEVVTDEHTVSRVVIEETEIARALSPLMLAGVLLLVVLAAGTAYLLARRHKSPQVKSLAVLPLKNLTGGADHRYLELGVADRIIGRVSEIPGLTVRPTGAVRKYIESNLDPLRIARELEVDSILDGTLQFAGNRVRVSLNLLETSGGSSVWTQVFDVPLRDIFEVEDEVSRQVTRHLRLQLGSAASNAARHSTRNVEAYEHYLKGIYVNEAPHATSRPAIEAAIIRFKKATELDPSFAQAWAQLAKCYGEVYNFHEADTAWADAARDAASRAYALDPDLPELLVFRAQMLWSWKSNYQIEEAIRELRRGVASNDADLLSLLGILYAHVGLDRQAIASIQRAIEIDPSNALLVDRLAQAYVQGGHYNEAKSAFERAFQVESEDRGNLHMSAFLFAYTGQLQEARRQFEKARFHNPRNPAAPAGLALIAALEGRFSEAEAAIPADHLELEKLRTSFHAFRCYAQIYGLQGKSAETVRWLRRSMGMGMQNYPRLVRDPLLARVRSSPDFVQFMAELKPRYEAIEREFR